MIWITGNTHSDFRRFSMNSFPEQRTMTKNDVVIIAGDFGGVWNYDGESSSERYWLNWLNDKPFTTVFVDGNHENFNRLYEYPVKKWNGGDVHEIRKSVLHLMRGEIFNIEGKKFWVFGGASSHDINDGILDWEKDHDKIKEWNRDPYKLFRIRNMSWWEQELPTQKEMDHGYQQLENAGYKVDYIVTHCPPASILEIMGRGMYDQDVLTEYLEGVISKTDFTKLFFGHMHEDIQINDKCIGLYKQIIRIA